MHLIAASTCLGGLMLLGIGLRPQTAAGQHTLMAWFTLIHC